MLLQIVSVDDVGSFDHSQVIAIRTKKTIFHSNVYDLFLFKVAKRLIFFLAIRHCNICVCLLMLFEEFLFSFFLPSIFIDKLVNIWHVNDVLCVCLCVNGPIAQFDELMCLCVCVTFSFSSY